MTKLTLVIGNKNYSSWSLRPWLAMKQAGLDFVWESLAICEYVAERFANDLWPADIAARAIARSICAEMHAGFQNLRENMPMDCRNRYPGEGMTPGVEAEIDRIFAIWRESRQKFGTGGDMLFGQFTIADAMFAPVVMRFVTYEVKLDAQAQAYADALLALPAMQEWLAAACSESESIPHLKI
ncbi:MAG: glutathione S-transferase [Oscillatoriales cyanobacterium]|nr:MAG: glutathione S-transferase [Oscillatoriales cyanobacterium]